MGCGAGVIGTVLARECAAKVTMVDVDLVAVEAARCTARSADVAVTVKPSDVYSNAEGTFDVLVCNPPFHQGVSTAYDISERIIAGAPKALRQGGELWLVANVFLKYQDLIEAAFGNCERVAKDKQFAVYHARRR